MSVDIRGEAFLFSSWLEVPDRFFQGYCFVGSDYIFGAEGAEEYLEATGRRVGGGEDGCYVSVRRCGSQYDFDTDVSGNKKLFYYFESGEWAVSNSLALLVDHVRRNGVALTPNFAQLSAAGRGSRSPFHNQLSTFSTIANGVRLVPARARLRIGVHGARIEQMKLPQTIGDYRCLINQTVALWQNRFATLLSTEGASIGCDLTGGLDSRVVFALLQRARTALGGAESAHVRIKSGTGPRNAGDLAVAQEICRAYRCELNGRRLATLARRSPTAAYAGWRDLCLGVYHPIYFPGSAPHPLRIAFGGGGGENYRPFYKGSAGHEFISRRSAVLQPRWLAHQYEVELASTFAYLNSVYPTGHDLLMAHYRQFRNRMHSGRAPQYSVTFSPLGTRLLEEASGIAPPGSLRSGQINYDIISVAMPDLLEFRFDSESKSPSKEVRERLVRGPLSLDVTPGRSFFRAPPASALSEGAGTQSVWGLLEAAYQAACDVAMVNEFWGAEFLGTAGDILSDAVRARSFRHAVDGQPISAVLATAMLAP